MLLPFLSLASLLILGFLATAGVEGKNWSEIKNLLIRTWRRPATFTDLVLISGVFILGLLFMAAYYHDPYPCSECITCGSD